MPVHARTRRCADTEQQHNSHTVCTSHAHFTRHCVHTQAYIKAKYEHKTFALRLRKPPLIKPAPDPAPDDLLGPVSPRSRGAEGMVEYIVSAQ
jgi:hypothetical protein